MIGPKYLLEIERSQNRDKSLGDESESTGLSGPLAYEVSENDKSSSYIGVSME